MTVPLHSHEFFSGHITGAGPTTLYTVPTGFLIVIKRISIQQTTTTARATSIKVNNAVNLWSSILGAYGTSSANVQLDLWAAVAAGKTITTDSVAGAGYDLNVSGYLYPLTL